MLKRSPAQTTVIGPEHAGRRLDNYLVYFLKNIPKTLIYKIIRRGEVRVNGSRARPQQRLHSGDKIRTPPLLIDDALAPMINTRHLDTLEDSILFEDEHIVVLNKPSGLAVHSGTGLKFGVVDAMRALRPDIEGPELVHRLDRETSGCLILAKDPLALRDLHRQLRDGEVEKRYTTLLKGTVGREIVRVKENLRSVRDQKNERRTEISALGRPAETRFRSLDDLSGASLVEAELLTGRTHQIRAHAAHIGHPVAGDRRYGDVQFNRALRAVGLHRLFLHANRLRFHLPNSRKVLCIDAPLPRELHDVIAQLRKTREFTE